MGLFDMSDTDQADDVILAATQILENASNTRLPQEY